MRCVALLLLLCLAGCGALNPAVRSTEMRDMTVGESAEVWIDRKVEITIGDGASIYINQNQPWDVQAPVSVRP